MTHADFLRPILDAPDDDAPRLIYADWLEERGDVRAEFIRVQCELADNAFGAGHDVFSPDCRVCVALARDRELRATKAAEDEWFAPVPSLVDKYDLRRGFVEAVTLPLAAWCGEKCPGCSGRGWWIVDSDPNDHSFTCQACGGHKRTPAHGPALVRAAPLREVRLTDANIYQVDGERDRHFLLRRDIPVEVWNLMECNDEHPGLWKRYPTRQDLTEALAAALLLWAARQPAPAHREG